MFTHLIDTDFFDIVYYLPWWRTWYIDRSNKNKMAFCWKKTIRRYPAEIIRDPDYADDIAILVNTPAQAEFRLLSLELASGSIGLHVNANKTEYKCFKREGATSTQSSGSLKIVDTYLGSSVSFTESDDIIRQAKARTIIIRLSIIWKSNLFDKIAWDFFKAMAVSKLLYGCTTSYLPTPPLGQDMTQGQFLSGV